jgi:hypothetical protein
MSARTRSVSTQDNITIHLVGESKLRDSDEKAPFPRRPRGRVNETPTEIRIKIWNHVIRHHGVRSPERELHLAVLGTAWYRFVTVSREVQESCRSFERVLRLLYRTSSSSKRLLARDRRIGKDNRTREGSIPGTVTICYGSSKAEILAEAELRSPEFPGAALSKVCHPLLLARKLWIQDRRFERSAEVEANFRPWKFATKPQADGVGLAEAQLSKDTGLIHWHVDGCSVDLQTHVSVLLRVRME